MLLHFLEKILQQNQQRYYYVFELTEGDDRQAWISCLQALQRKYRLLSFVELCLDPALQGQQTRRYRPLKDLLRL